MGDLPERDKFPDQGGRAFPTMRSHVWTAPEVVRELSRANKARKAFAKLKNESAGCSGDLRFLLVGGEASRRRPATGRAVRPLGGLGWGMRLRLPWLGIVASFRKDDLFEGETCQKSGGFHHLGKNSSEEGKVARKRQFADHCARFAWVLRVLGVLVRSPTKGVSSVQLK